MNPTEDIPDSAAKRTDTGHDAAIETVGVSQFVLDAPLYQEEAFQADRIRREAAAAAFRNEKAHERPPRHQA